MSQIDQPINPPRTTGSISASWGRRVLATLFDAVITIAAVVLVTLASGQFEVAAPYLDGTLFYRACAIVVISYLLLHGWTLYRGSQTLGKRLFKLRITSGGANASFVRLLFRAGALWSLILIPVVGVWLQGLHLVDALLFCLPAHRALHDRITNTTVVDEGA